MSFSSAEIVILFAALLSALVTGTGWYFNNRSHKKLFDAKVADEQKRYDRDRRASQLAVFDDLMSANAELVLEADFMFQNTEVSPPPDDRVEQFRRKTIKYSTLLTKAADIAHQLDPSGQIEERLQDLLLSTFFLVGGMRKKVAEVLGSKITPEIEEQMKSNARKSNSEARRQIRSWLEEMQRAQPADW